MIIGEKNKFAIEVSVSNNNWGNARLWFDNNVLGTFDEEIPLKGYLLSGLNRISLSKQIDMDLSHMQKNTIFEVLIQRLNDSSDSFIHDYLINDFGTFCDDFIIFSFLSKEKLHIIWKLTSNDTPFKDLNNMNLEIKHYTTTLEKFNDNVHELKRRLDNIIG
ncbi:Imm42 family immunity protein [uncultured Winogradskyella sp.]|uniref:Imm42 family immunity protein n=1 Tax=uncultured Winogradskyella sp. TaxID=395353 RepID=UPI00261AF748|nr:Imm42 family immunity protein [uncultured Winogradskyella sp.]